MVKFIKRLIVGLLTLGAIIGIGFFVVGYIETILGILLGIMLGILAWAIGDLVFYLLGWD